MQAGAGSAAGMRGVRALGRGVGTTAEMDSALSRPSSGVGSVAAMPTIEAVESALISM